MLRLREKAEQAEPPAMERHEQAEPPAMERCAAPVVINIDDSITDSISSMSNGDTVVKVESKEGSWWDNYQGNTSSDTTTSPKDIIDLSSSIPLTFPTKITAAKKRTRRASNEVNRLRIEAKRKKEESINRYTIALKEAIKQWSLSQDSQRTIAESIRYSTKCSSNINSLKHMSANDVCDMVNSKLQYGDKKVTKTTLL